MVFAVVESVKQLSNQEKRGLTMKMTRDEKIAKCVELAKAKYGENYTAGLWGSAQVLLPETKLDVIIRVMEKN
jgi:hypothetical protein